MRLRVACLLGAGVAVTAFAACSGSTEPGAGPDAAVTSATPSASMAPAMPDAGDAAEPRDAPTDSPILDAADGMDAMDAADGYDGAPLPGSVTTAADIPGLTDFDFVGSHMLYRRGVTTANDPLDFRHCTLPACTDETSFNDPPGLEDPQHNIAAWSAGEDGRLHYLEQNHSGATWAPQLGVVSVLFDNTNHSFAPVYQGIYGVSLRAYHAGHVAVTIVQSQGPWFGGPMGGGCCWSLGFDSLSWAGINTGRVDRARGLYHTNDGGAVVNYIPFSRVANYNVPPTTASLEGVSAPVPATPPTLVAVSAAGPTVPRPTVVVLRDGNVEACALATPCLAWLNLGALGTILNLDDKHLYIGTPTGLSRCALAEIGTAGTCTLVPHGPVEAVEEPLYLTGTHAWYRSSTKVRRRQSQAAIPMR